MDQSQMFLKIYENSYQPFCIIKHTICVLCGIIFVKENASTWHKEEDVEKGCQAETFTSNYKTNNRNESSKNVCNRV